MFVTRDIVTASYSTIIEKNEKNCLCGCSGNCCFSCSTGWKFSYLVSDAACLLACNQRFISLQASIARQGCPSLMTNQKIVIHPDFS